MRKSYKSADILIQDWRKKRRSGYPVSFQRPAYLFYPVSILNEEGKQIETTSKPMIFARDFFGVWAQTKPKKQYQKYHIVFLPTGQEIGTIGNKTKAKKIVSELSRSISFPKATLDQKFPFMPSYPHDNPKFLKIIRQLQRKIKKNGGKTYPIKEIQPPKQKQLSLFDPIELPTKKEIPLPITLKELRLLSPGTSEKNIKSIWAKHKKLIKQIQKNPRDPRLNTEIPQSVFFNFDRMISEEAGKKLEEELLDTRAALQEKTAAEFEADQKKRLLSLRRRRLTGVAPRKF